MKFSIFDFRFSIVGKGVLASFLIVGCAIMLEANTDKINPDSCSKNAPEGTQKSCGGNNTLPLERFGVTIPAASSFALAPASTGTKISVAPKEQKKENKKVLTEWSAIFGGIPEGGTHVIRDTESWKNLWVRMQEGEPPQVDFSKHIAVAVFMGMKPTGGYAVKITKVEKSKSKWTVYVEERHPSKGGMVIEAFTTPYHIKLIDRTDLPVEFKTIR